MEMSTTPSDELLAVGGSALEASMPEWHWCETYGRWVDAAPGEALEAAASVRVRDVEFLRVLLFLRSAPSRLKGSGGLAGPGISDEPIVSVMEQNGFLGLGRSPHERAFGMVDQAWKSDGGTRIDLGSKDEFEGFDRPGFVKIAANLRAREHRGGTFLSTETRVLATDRRTRRLFGLYWLFIRPFSGLTRRSWLSAAERSLARR